MILDAGIEPRQLAGWRIMSAAILMTVMLVVLRRMRFRCSRRAFVSIVLFGLFGVALPQWLYYEAISRFDVGLTLVIVYTAPLWVAGIHRVTRGTRQPRQVTAAMALALVGVAIAVLGGGELSNGSALGLVLAIATSIAYAAQLMLAEHLDQSLPASSRVALSMIVGGVFWLVLPAVRDLPDRPAAERRAVRAAGLHGADDGADRLRRDRRHHRAVRVAGRRRQRASGRSPQASPA